MDDVDLVRRLANQHGDIDSSGFNITDFVHAVGSGLDALMYSRLFWPEFVEIRGMIFLKETVEDEEDRSLVAKTLERYGGQKQPVEKDLNFVEVAHLFGSRAGETTEAEDSLLAERLVEMWRCKLKLRYPARIFVVETVPSEEDAGMGVVFYQAGLDEL